MTIRRSRALTLTLLLANASLLADLTSIVPEGATVRKVAGDCNFTEGPAWSPEGYLLFSDIPNSRILRVDTDGKVSEFLKPSGRANGLAFNAKGELFACQGAGEGGEMRLAQIDAKTKKQTALVDRFEGKRLNSPNDLALDASGGVYFTDPRYGGQQPTEQPVMGVYYRDAKGQVSRIVDDLARPNGILVSPSGKHLYVAEPNKRELYRYDIAAPGKISGKKLIFTGTPEDGGGPDGMAHDVNGNVYATYQSVIVLDPNGKALGRIPVPERPSNCTFGGEDGKTLFITARKSLYAIDLAVAGAPLAGASATKSQLRDEKIGVLTMKVPVSWKRSQPRSRMRKGQFDVAPVKGDAEAAELVIYYFGPNQGGGVAANVNRWIGQFDASDRKVRVLSGKAPTGNYTIVDAAGTYNKPIGPPIAGRKKATPGQRMLAVVLPTSEGSYFLKFTGPAKTVDANAEAFRVAFGGDASKEREQL